MSTRASRLSARRKRNKRITLVSLVAVVGLCLTGWAYAAVSSHPFVYACFGDTDGKAKSGLQEFAPTCGRGSHLKSIAASDEPVSSTTGGTTTTSTTTTQPTGAIIPAGIKCLASSGNSVYQGNRLTETQAVQALWAGGFRTVADLRAFVAIGHAESQLCPLTWNYHPEFGPGQADRGWLQSQRSRRQWRSCARSSPPLRAVSAPVPARSGVLALGAKFPDGREPGHHAARRASGFGSGRVCALGIMRGPSKMRFPLGFKV